MATWDFAAIRKRCEESDLWVARMIYRLAKDFDSIEVSSLDAGTVQDDRVYFRELLKFFEENHHFTDRHIFLARRKIRDPYITYLVSVANT